jgi:hypothetical protein
MNASKRLSEGLLDGEVIQELLGEKMLNIEDTITKCCGLESAKMSREGQQKSMHSEVTLLQIPALGVATLTVMEVARNAQPSTKLVVIIAR